MGQNTTQVYNLTLFQRQGPKGFWKKRVSKGKISKQKWQSSKILKNTEPTSATCLLADSTSHCEKASNFTVVFEAAWGPRPTKQPVSKLSWALPPRSTSRQSAPESLPAGYQPIQRLLMTISCLDLIHVKIKVRQFSPNGVIRYRVNNGTTITD